LKILRVISGTNLAEGGPIEGVRQITRILTARGHVTEVASLDRDDAPWLSESEFKVHALGTGRDSYFNAPRLTQWLADHARDYDVVIQHGLWNASAFATMRGMRKAKRNYLVYTHGMLDPWFKHAYPLKHAAKQTLWFISEGRLLHGADYVLFTTEEERLAARRSFWPSRYRERVVKYGTGDIRLDDAAQRAAEFRALLPQLSDAPFLLFLSRIHPKKGCDLLVDAFAEIAAQRPELHLVIAGPDDSGLVPELSARAERLGIAGRLHWPGMLKGDAKRGAFFASEAFVLPSHQENFGIAVAEAMASGKPVLLTDKVNIWREVTGCGGGLVAGDDAAGVVSLLKGFLQLTPEQKAEMGAKARAGFLTYFEIGAVADTLLEVLEESAARGPRGAAHVGMAQAS